MRLLRSRYRRLGLLLFVASMSALGGCESSPTKTAPPIAEAPVVRTGSAATPTPAPGVVAEGSNGSAAAAVDPWLKQAPTPKQPIPHPLFWSIEKDGKTTYLLGTMHVGIDAESRLPNVVWGKLDAAPVFAMETNINDASLEDMVRKDGGTLHKDLGDAYWTKLETAVTKPVAKNIDKMKPMVAATFLSMRGLPQTAAMDGVLLGRAINEHKDIIYLEAAGKQAAILEKWMNLKALKMMLDHLPDAEKNTKEMLQAYLDGDDKKILALGEAERVEAKASGFTDAEFDQQNEDLLYGRNASWIDGIEKLHARGGGFIAVGAMHLIGKKSVLELLAAKGYTVARIVPPAP